MVIFNGLHLLQMVQKLKNPRQHLRSWYIYGMQIPWVRNQIVRQFPELVTRLAYRMGGLSEENRPETRNDSVATPSNQYSAFLRDLPQIYRRKIRPIDAPVLVVWGEKDPFINSITSDEFEGYAKNVTFRFLPKGHWHFREDPNETNQILQDFFEVTNA